MKTLKKTLCLVLAVVMVVGTLAVSASATKFTDDASVTAEYKEAVELITGLKVMNGIGDNKFDPQGTLTREMAAQIVAVVSLGYDGWKTLSGTKSTFDDVADGHWAVPSIEYCRTAKITAGVGGNNFGPKQVLNGDQFERMLLVALGYDYEKENISSETWSAGTQTLAYKAGLVTGLKGDFVATNPITREQACQMAFNALFADTVSYTGGVKVPTEHGDIVVGAQPYANNDDMKLGARFHKIKGVDTGTTTIIEDVITSNSAVADTKGNTVVGSTYISTDTGADLYNHYVKVYVKDDGNLGTALKPYTAIAIIDCSEVIEVSATDNINSAAKWEKKFGKRDMDPLTDLAQGTSGAGKADFDNNTYACPGKYVFNTTDNTLVAFIAPITYTATKVTAITTTAGSESISVVGAATIENNETTDNANEYDGIAKGDIVITYSLDGGDIVNIQKAEVVTGKISAKTAANKVTVNGKEYAVSAVVDNSGITDATLNFTDEFKFYLTPDGEYFAVEKVSEAAAASTDIMQYVTVYKVDDTANAYGEMGQKWYAQVVDADGKEHSYLIGVSLNQDNDVSDTNEEGATSCTTGLITFAPTAGSKLGVYTATAAPSAVASGKQAGTQVSGNQVVDSKNTDITTDLGKTYVNSSTKYVFFSGTGSTLKTEVVVGGVNCQIDDNDWVVVHKDVDGNYVADVVYMNKDYTNAGLTADTLLYLAGTSYSKQLSNTTYEWEVYDIAAGKKVTITASNASVAATGFHKYSIVDGVYNIENSALATVDDPNANGWHDNQTYKGKIGTKITTEELEDLETSGAVVFDVRAAATVTSDAVGALNSLEAIHAAKTAEAPKTAIVDVYVSGDKVIAIVVTSTVSADTSLSSLTYDGNEFVADTNGEYTIYGINGKTLAATASSGTVTYDIDGNGTFGEAADTGTNVSAFVIGGTAKTIKVKVTATDSITSKIYVVHVPAGFAVTITDGSSRLASVKTDDKSISSTNVVTEGAVIKITTGATAPSALTVAAADGTPASIALTPVATTPTLNTDYTFTMPGEAVTITATA